MKMSEECKQSLSGRRPIRQSWRMQADTTQKDLEPRIRSQILKLRIPLYPDEPGVMGITRSTKPVERGIFFAQARIDSCEGIRWRIRSSEKPFQFFKHLVCPFLVTCHCVGISQCTQHVSGSAEEPCLAALFYRQLKFSL